MLNDLLYLVLAAPLLAYALSLVPRVLRAIMIADERMGRYSPPPQLWIENGEWKTAPGSQRVAWWRTFWKAI